MRRSRFLGHGLLVAALVATAALPAMAGMAPLHSTVQPAVNAQLIEIPQADGVVAVWAEVLAGGGIANYYMISRDGQWFDRVYETSNQIELRYAHFDPLLDAPAVPSALAASDANRVYLVQFVTHPLGEYQDAVAALGGEVYAPLFPQNAVAVRMTPEVRDAVACLPLVRAIVPYHPAFKLDEVILDALEMNYGVDVPQGYSISVFRRGLEQQQEVTDLLLSLGGEVINTSPDGHRMTVHATPTQVAALAHLDGVHFIDPWAVGGPDMDIVRNLSGANHVENKTGYTGEGVRAEVYDSGAIPNHVEWGGKTPLYRKNTQTGGSHGTAVYGVLFAKGVKAKARGVNPGYEQGIACYAYLSTQFGGQYTRLHLNTEARDPKGIYRSLFQTSSYGSPRTRNYTTISQETDDYLFQVDYLSCQSMSNANLQPDTRPQAWAKNIIGVMGINHNDNPVRTTHSAYGSIGPASDGRSKPDVAHFYDKIHTTYSTSPTGYGEFGGTSGATPCTCSHVGLASEMWHKEVFKGHGGGAGIFEDQPWSSTIRAMLFNTAYRYNWKAGGSNSNMWRTRQGWGMVDIGKLYDGRDKTVIIDETDLVLPQQKNTYQYTVPAGEAELCITMVYRDLPGNPANQSQHRVNDLSMKVLDPNNTLYWGNHNLVTPIDTGTNHDNWSLPGGTRDTKNVVECVFLQNPQAGVWTIEISGDEIIKDAWPKTPEIDAAYALVVRGVSPRVLGDMNCDGKVNFGDINPFILALTDPVKYKQQFPNCDIMNGDINGDNQVDFEDINPFIRLLS